MPRSSRIDAPGALHHIIFRGIDRGKIFEDDEDRKDFLDRLDTHLQETKTPCFAWALIPNHTHLLLRTGAVPIATVMRRLLTGYAVRFNRRHKRHGHLFQNRYKSILCEEEAYLLELVRYIHLNPLRAGLVRSIGELDKHAYSGHSALMGIIERPWQDVDTVLGRFGGDHESSRKSYRAFVADGVAQGERPDLVGGGLIRSQGGWEAVKALRSQKIRAMADERILGDSEFVEKALRHAEEELLRRAGLKKRGYDIDSVTERAASVFDVSVADIYGGGKSRPRAKARSLFCYWATHELGITAMELARLLKLDQSSVSKAARRGEHLSRELGVRLEPQKS